MTKVKKQSAEIKKHEEHMDSFLKALAAVNAFRKQQVKKQGK